MWWTVEESSSFNLPKLKKKEKKNAAV